MAGTPYAAYRGLVQHRGWVIAAVLVALVTATAVWRLNAQGPRQLQSNGVVIAPEGPAPSVTSSVPGGQVSPVRSAPTRSARSPEPAHPVPLSPASGGLLVPSSPTPQGRPEHGAPAPRPGSGVKVPDSVETIISDMTAAGDGRLHGVPAGAPWASCTGSTDDPDNARHFTAASAWGQVYEDSRGNPARAARVELKDIKTFVLSRRERSWRLAQSSVHVAGLASPEDFSSGPDRAIDARIEKDGFQSVTAGNGYNVHFWPEGPRARIDPSDTAGVFTTVQARVIGPQSAQARYLMSAGGDWWIDETAGWAPDHIGGIGGGRCKAVTTRWQSFNMITLSPAQVRSSPPPLG